jgi:hypothetical protein
MATQTFKTSADEIAAYERAARASGLGKSEWMRLVLAVAAGVRVHLEGPLAQGVSSKKPKKGSDADLTQSFKVSDAEIEAYMKAAAAAFQKRSVWVRQVLAAASGISDWPAQMARLATVQNKPVDDGEW